MKGKTSRILQMLLVIICVNLIMLFQESGKVHKTLVSVDRDAEEPQQQQRGQQHEQPHQPQQQQQQQEQEQHVPQEWHDWFRPLTTWQPILAVNASIPTRDHSIHQVLFYHVMKAGGSSLYRMFYRMSLKYQHNVDQCGWTGECCGVESPGRLSIFADHWKSLPSVHPKLLAIAFREPVERTISHYFQVKPCPDGDGGGSDRRCTNSAKNGLSSFLENCKYSSNFQTKYLDDRFENLQHVDVVLRSDKIEESLVLMSIKYKIPILDLIYTRDKAKLAGDKMGKGRRKPTKNRGGRKDPRRTRHDEAAGAVSADEMDRHFPGFELPNHRKRGLDRDEGPDDSFEAENRRRRPRESDNSKDEMLRRRERLKELEKLHSRNDRLFDRRIGALKGLPFDIHRRGGSGKSCTLQWMKQMLSKEALQTLQNCTISCAGLMGRLAFKEDEIDEIKALNQRDLILWNEHVIPRYERDKANILQQYNVSQSELNAIVERYSTVQKDFEQYLPKPMKQQRTKKKRSARCGVHSPKHVGDLVGLLKGRTRKGTNLMKETEATDDNTSDEDDDDVEDDDVEDDDVEDDDVDDDELDDDSVM